MKIWAPPQNNFVYDQSGHLCCMYTYEIGAWNMMVTPNKHVAHGLGLDYIYMTGIVCSIRNDLGTWLYNISGTSIQRFPAPHNIELSVEVIDNTWIYLSVDTGGSFGTADYNDPAINRGIIQLFLRR